MLKKPRKQKIKWVPLDKIQSTEMTIFLVCFIISVIIIFVEKDINISNTSTPKKDKEKESNGILDTSKSDSISNALENGSLDEEDAVDDKLWADVDKDLGDILREVEPNKSSDDEDDSRTTSVR